MVFKNEKINSKNEINNLNNDALVLVKMSKLNEAFALFNNALKQNFLDFTAETGAKCCKYWDTRINKINSIDEPFKKGKTLLDEWLKFEKFIRSLKNVELEVVKIFKEYIFTLVLKAFKILKEESKIFDLEVAFYISLSLKRIGEYKEAIKSLEEALIYEPDNSNLMSQIADCYALLDDEKKAKLLFREAFFIDPSSIDIKLLDSKLITFLLTIIEEYQEPEIEINYWIPVYAQATGVFSVVRELLPSEIIKIKRDIISIENSFNIKNDGVIRAKLLNLYFWYYDYVKYFNKDIKELANIENSIKAISEKIYMIFKNRCI